MTTKENQESLKPTIGILTALALVVGNMIGSGIFKKPSSMAQELGSPEWLIAVWVFTGLITLFGALSNAEVASVLPRTGGQYIYFKELFGEKTAFLYGWALFIVIQTASIGSIAFVAAEYALKLLNVGEIFQAISTSRSLELEIPLIGTFAPFHDFTLKLLTVSILVIFTAINYRNVKAGGAVQTFLTIAKVVAILFIVGAAFSYVNGSTDNWSSAQLPPDSSNQRSSSFLLFGIIPAMTAAFWAYDGWNSLTWVSGEVKNARKTVPRSLIFGTLMCIAIYVLVNLAYLYVSPIEEIARNKYIAAHVAEISMGTAGVVFVSLAVVISTLGATNATVLQSARVFYAMAKDKLFLPSLGKIHEKNLSPARALVVQCVWASILVFSGSFDALTDLLIFVSWVFYFLGGLSIFILRKKFPDAPRPYRAFGYPVIPAIFVLFSFLFVVNTLFADMTKIVGGDSSGYNNLIGIALTLSGLPVFYYHKWKLRQENSSKGDS